MPEAPKRPSNLREGRGRVRDQPNNFHAGIEASPMDTSQLGGGGGEGMCWGSGQQTH